MSTRRKISVRKIIQTLVTLIAVTGCTLAMISADRQQTRRKVKGVQLVVKSPGSVHFLTEDAVRSMLFTGRHVAPQQLNLTQIDERSMEAILRANPWVKDAQVYTDAESIVHVSLTQRVPVVRIFEEDGNSYYLDAALQSMPLSTQYTHYTPVVTGVPKLRADSAASVVKGKIVGLIQNIGRDTFWNAQVSQINMRADGGFEFIPVLGKQRIIIGDTALLDEKLDNLFAFYSQVQNKVGWDRYTTLDLRYKNQVVASPSLPWKAPVDRALATHNWLQAIMDNAPISTQLGGDAAAWSDESPASMPKPATATPTPPPPATNPPAANKPVSKQPPAKPQTAKPAVPVKPKITPQAAAPKPKYTLPAAASKAKPTKPQQPSQNTSRHKQNTPPHATTIR